MRLTMTMFQSIDGVVQSPGAPQEDQSGGFDLGGWLPPLFDEETGAYMVAVFDQVDAFLLGRRTYDIFAGYWPNVTDPNDPIATKLNSLPKYVATNTLEESDWQGTELLAGDLAEKVAELKQRDGRELQIHGSPTLVRSLATQDLIDTFRLLTFPVVLGRGQRLFGDGTMPTALRLSEARTTPSGVAINTYQLAGRPAFAAVAGMD